MAVTRRRRCKHGKLKRSIRTKSGGKRRCRKTSRRRRKRRSKSKRRRRRTKSKRRRRRRKRKHGMGHLPLGPSKKLKMGGKRKYSAGHKEGYKHCGA